jgi:hypothetical protein
MDTKVSLQKYLRITKTVHVCWIHYGNRLWNKVSAIKDERDNLPYRYCSVHLNIHFWRLPNSAETKQFIFNQGLHTSTLVFRAHRSVMLHSFLLWPYNPLHTPPPESSADASLCSANSVTKITRLCKSDSFVLKNARMFMQKAKTLGK